MAPLDSPLTSYSDTTPHKRAIEDAISLIDPADTVAIDAIGGLDGAMGKFRLVNWPHTKVEWLEDTLAPLTDTLSASITSTTTTISVADASVFQPGDIILLDSEQMWVSAVTLASELLTVTRAYSGSSATHQTGTITIVGQARLEGDDSDAVAFTDRTAPYNYTQIFQKEVKVSRTQSQLSQYGIDNEYDYQVEKIVPELGRRIERQLFYGARKAGSATTPRAFGGFSTFITDNLVDFGAAITQSAFENAVKAAYNDGGGPRWVAFLSPDNLQTVKNIYDSSVYLRVDRSETAIGMTIETVRTPFGDVSLMLDRWATDTEVWIVDPNHAGMLTYYPFSEEMLAKDGDYVKGEVVGEFTFLLRQDKAHAALTT